MLYPAASVGSVSFCVNVVRVVSSGHFWFHRKKKMDATTAQTANATERRMDVEFTVGEIQKMYVLAIRERARTNDKDLEVVNLARKLVEFRRRAAS